MIAMLGISGYSGSGKTTLLEKLLPHLQAKGLRVAVIKHSHHNTQIDKVGKDSWRMKEAGATQVMLACEERWALMTETPSQPVNLTYLAQQFDRTLTDLVLVEGFKQEPIKKIFLHRHNLNKPFPILDENVIAVATDYPLSLSLPHFNLNDIASLAQFILTCHKQGQLEQSAV